MRNPQQEVEPTPGRMESDAWLNTYADDSQSQRRRRMMPRKLSLLGLGKVIDKNAAVLDLCCGHGETLDVLYELGFRDLSGVDIHITEQLRRDARFTSYKDDACEPSSVPSESKDWILVLHSLHHLETPERIRLLVDHAHRILKPGGLVSFVDFPNSPQIMAAFWFFLHFKPLLLSPYLKWFGSIVEEEWPFLQHYMPRFPRVWDVLHDPRFTIEAEHHEFFYFYLTLRKR